MGQLDLFSWFVLFSGYYSVAFSSQGGKVLAKFCAIFFELSGISCIGDASAYLFLLFKPLLTVRTPIFTLVVN